MMTSTFLWSAVAALAVLALLAFFIVRRKRSVQAEVEAAIAQGLYQFIALLDSDGNWTYPQVPGVPDWYFQNTGVHIHMTKPETREADLAYMQKYNEALYRTLQAQGKFHLIEQDIALVKSNLEPMQEE